MGHRPTDPAGDRLRVRSRVALGVTTVGLVTLAAGLIVGLPLLTKSWDEHGLLLPTATTYLIRARWAVAAFLAVWGTALFLKELTPLPRRTTLFMNAVSLAAAIGLACAVLAIVGLPFLELRAGMAK